VYIMKTLNVKKSKSIFFGIIFQFLFIGISSNLFANNISVNNVSLTGYNPSNSYVMIEFDISWDNSWRTSVGPSNWDAAWIFVKYRLKNESIWNHALLNWVDGTGSGDGHYEPVNTNIASSNKLCRSTITMELW